MTNYRDDREKMMRQRRARQKARQRRIEQIKVIVFGIIVSIFVIALLGVSYIYVKKYTPTKERMELTSYFLYSKDAEAAVIMDGEYLPVEAGDNVYAISKDGVLYLELDFVKKNLDDGYVFDYTEKVLRYTTENTLYSANLDSSSYTANRDSKSLSHPVVVSQYGGAYIAIDFLSQFSDFQYSYVPEPSRIMIEHAGWTHQITTLKANTELRRFGGNKSAILEDGKKDEKVIVLEDYGTWSLVLSENAVLGCVKNQKLNEISSETTISVIDERHYNHIKFDGQVCLGWHQMSNKDGNEKLETLVKAAPAMNVIAPTWFSLTDNFGNISDLGSRDYVTKAHGMGLQVWATVNNIDGGAVDCTQILNTTSSRDNLVNNVVAAAISYDLDGINIDLESLKSSAADGYIQFIRELSLKCENNGIILSVDNYVPSDYTAFYNRKEQAKYADYIVVMAYDEHYIGSEAGSVSSIGFVSDGATNTLKEVPADQIVLALPFYCRVWTIAADGSTTSEAYSLGNIAKHIDNHNLTLTWDDTLGQNYGEYSSSSGTNKIWVEDKKSLELKMNVYKANNLAGVAFWRLGMSTDAVWAMIGEYL